jgi:hypothetical protein
MRKALLALSVLALAATLGTAQQGAWAEKMFQGNLTHDFGSVPYGAQLFHRFTITNIYAVRMEITGIKPGCGCVTVEPAKRVLEPRESTTIDVRMDARRFKGPKTVGIRVSVGPDFISSAELKVSANSRADIVFNPSQVAFGTVVRGQAPVQTIDVEYAGSLPWQVSEVVAKDLPLDVGLKELYRRPGQVGYQVRIALKPDAPIGPLKEDIFLKTNDPASPLVAILVEANVQPAITVSPPVLSLGAVQVGQLLTRRVVVRGSRPFRILGVDGTGAGTGITLVGALAGNPSPVQIVTFQCQFNQPGDFKRELKIKTDLQEEGVSVSVEGSAGP